MNRIGYIRAETHSPEYAWHKYWSRKPANVISKYLQALVPVGGSVVDPFCGSGVVLLEAHKLGLEAVGFDVNPTALNISNFLLDPPLSEQFEETISEALRVLDSEFLNVYKTARGESIRFLIHHVVVDCTNCGNENIFNKDVQGSNGKKCFACASKLSFNLSSLKRTQISKIILTDGTELSDLQEIQRQTEISDSFRESLVKFPGNFSDNPRTLTANSFRTSDYFTSRNFAILSRLTELAHVQTSIEMRRAFLLLVTSSSAQLSRLIASRGGLKTGGQAWTIPGFWVPPIHIESNPFLHFSARMRKMNKAIKTVEKLNLSQNPKCEAMPYSALSGLTELVLKKKKADLVFLDPPYGDSVAFLEFSSIWNAFLQEKVIFSSDISISNRLDDPFLAQDYERELILIFHKVNEVLHDEGCVVLTFNNNDLQSWSTIVKAAQINSLRVYEVNYQDPAVISTKAQMSLQGSYVGDFYVIFKKSNCELRDFSDIETDLAAFLHRAACVRGGSLPLGLLMRFGLQYFLEMNVNANSVERLLDVIEGNFRKNKDLYTAVCVNDMSTSIDKLSRDFLSMYVGPFDEPSLYNFLKSHLSNYGLPSLIELESIVQEFLAQCVDDGATQLIIDF